MSDGHDLLCNMQALHALLEPGYPAQHPDVAVVGISNWALDAAKMSRAVLLSRCIGLVSTLGCASLSA